MRGGLREFFLVFGSVLMALAAQAWWEHHKDRQREQVYLGQLAAELDASEPALEEARAFAYEIERKATLLHRAALSAAPPPEDSLRQWLLQVDGYPVEQAMLGTARALIATGDLRLIRDDAARTAIVVLVEHVDREGARAQSWERINRDAYHRLDASAPWYVIAVQEIPSTVRDSTASVDDQYAWPAGPLRALPRPEIGTLLHEPRFYQAVTEVMTSAFILRTALESQLEEVRRVRPLLQQAVR